MNFSCYFVLMFYFSDLNSSLFPISAQQIENHYCKVPNKIDNHFQRKVLICTKGNAKRNCLQDEIFPIKRVKSFIDLLAVENLRFHFTIIFFTTTLVFNQRSCSCNNSNLFLILFYSPSFSICHNYLYYCNKIVVSAYIFIIGNFLTLKGSWLKFGFIIFLSKNLKFVALFCFLYLRLVYVKNA